MDTKINTKAVADALKNDTYMPYFLNAENEAFFRENLLDVYNQFKEYEPDALYFAEQELTEADWTTNKFVGSLFLTLFAHWTKVIENSNLFYVEVNKGFPDELALDLDEKSFVVFYRAKSNMISHRDECIFNADNAWIQTFFDWVCTEINDVGSLDNLADKYSAFLTILTDESQPIEKEDENNQPYYQFPEEYYDNMDVLYKSVYDAIEVEMDSRQLSLDEEDEDSVPFILGMAVDQNGNANIITEPKQINNSESSSKSEDEKHLSESEKFESFVVNFKWNGRDTTISFPVDVHNSLENGSLPVDLLDNQNGWLAQQEAPIKELLFTLWLDYIYAECHDSFIEAKEPNDFSLSLTWTNFGSSVRYWLRSDNVSEPEKIDKKIRNIVNALKNVSHSYNFAHSALREKFFKIVLYIEKYAAIADGKFCVLDVENIQNQYMFGLNKDHVLNQLWPSITQEKIIKTKTRPTFTSQFDALKDKFPNFKEIIEYYSGAMYIFEQTGTPPAPVLLLGSPGLGKTHFSNELARVVGSMMTVIPVSSLSAGWVISGAAAQWKDAQMGKVASALLNGTSMSPVIVLDEIDKKSEGNYDPLGALYPLLEYQTAKEFVDEYLDFPMDASNIIWVATANKLNGIPEPILDRFVIFDVAQLNKEETIKVAKSIFTDLTRGLTPENLSPEILEILQDKTPRQIKQVLKKALAYAAVQRTQSIVLKKDHLDLQTKVKKLGF
jgi:ATP-dependent Lon protease